MVSSGSNNTNSTRVSNPPVIVNITNCSNIIVRVSVTLAANNDPAQPPTGVNDEDGNGKGEEEVGASLLAAGASGGASTRPLSNWSSTKPTGWCWCCFRGRYRNVGAPSAAVECALEQPLLFVPLNMLLPAQTLPVHTPLPTTTQPMMMTIVSTIHCNRRRQCRWWWVPRTSVGVPAAKSNAWNRGTWWCTSRRM